MPTAALAVCGVTSATALVLATASLPLVTKETARAGHVSPDSAEGGVRPIALTNIVISAVLTSLPAVDVKMVGMGLTVKRIARSHTAVQRLVTKSQENAILVRVVGLANTAKRSA